MAYILHLLKYYQSGVNKIAVVFLIECSVLFFYHTMNLHGAKNI